MFSFFFTFFLISPTVANVYGVFMVEDFQEESNTKAKIILIEQKYKSDRFTDNIIGKVKNISDDNNVNWISYYARQGFVEFYRKRIQETELIQTNTFQQWLYETSKPNSQKDKHLILDLVSQLRANNQQLASLGMVTPIIATIKNIMDNNKDKIDNTSRFIQHHSNQYQISEEEETNTSDQRTTTITIIATDQQQIQNEISIGNFN